MSMYTTLLGTALDQRDQTERAATIGDLFAQMLRTRIRLTASGITSPKQAKTLGDVTNQLSYDVSLISLVRRLGGTFAVERFDNGERRLLEQALIDQGIPLDELDELT
jgi:hypothetical protein